MSNSKPTRLDDGNLSNTFTDLPSSIVATIFSYVVVTTRDFARLRLVSGKITSDVLPLIFTSLRNGVKGGGSFIKCCYGNMDFLSEMISVDEECYRTGCTWNFPTGSRVCSLFEGSVMQSIFIIDEFNGTHTRSTEKTKIQHAELCNKMCNAANIDELQHLDGVARESGVFLPLHVPLVTNTESDQIRPDITDTDDTMYEDLIFNAILTLKVPHNAPCLKRRNEASLQLISIVPEKKISDWVERESENNELVFFLPHREDEGGIYFGDIIHTSTNESTVRVAMRVRSIDETMWELEASNFCCELLFLSALWNKYQEMMLISEGVAIADGILHSKSQKRLMGMIDKLAATQEVNCHPHSNNVVRDLVHPTLYSYVRGVSPTSSLDEVLPCEFTYDTDRNESKDQLNSMIKHDYWGRKYEETEYQWLPTYFDVAVNGTCSICDYVNNLVPREKYSELYSALENLFSQVLPLLESVYSYGREVKPRLRHHDDGVGEMFDAKPPSPIKEKYFPLRGQRLQVITKIVDYELQPGQSHEGVWDIEGMPQENIVATALYVLHRDDEIVGGDILFKRAYHQDEATFIFSSMSQAIRPRPLEDMINNGLIPLGKVQTRPGRLIVFPNSHVHKVGEIQNQATCGAVDGKAAKRDSESKRRLVVFLLVNPEKRIISTREIPPPQQ